MIRKPYKFIGIMLLGIVAGGCAKKTLPNGGVYFPMDYHKHEYSINVFYENDEPSVPYDIIKDLAISMQKPLEPNDKPVGGRMLYRGITKEQKDALIAKMVSEAQDLGAAAVIRVKYRYFTAADYDGYEITGKAIRYRVMK